MPPQQFGRLLIEDAARFSDLLERLGQARDLADIDHPCPGDPAGWQLMRAPCKLLGIGPPTASKLIARKPPRLRPVWDSVVVEVTGTRELQWEPMRDALHADGAALHQRLLRLRDQAGSTHALAPTASSTGSPGGRAKIAACDPGHHL